VVSIFPAEYDMMFEVEDSKEEFDPKDIEEYKQGFERRWRNIPAH